jgi:hypothetical protein
MISQGSQTLHRAAHTISAYTDMHTLYTATATATDAGLVPHTNHLHSQLWQQFTLLQRLDPVSAASSSS